MAISTASTLSPGLALYSSAGNALWVFLVATAGVIGIDLTLKTEALAFGRSRCLAPRLIPDRLRHAGMA